MSRMRLAVAGSAAVAGFLALTFAFWRPAPPIEFIPLVLESFHQDGTTATVILRASGEWELSAPADELKNDALYKFDQAARCIIDELAEHGVPSAPEQSMMILRRCRHFFYADVRKQEV